MNKPSPTAKLIETLQADEKAIITTLLTRLCSGREIYGPWRVDDGRPNPQEALLEVIDALHYCAAELVRLSQFENDNGPRRPRVYVCHPYSCDPETNVDSIKHICRALVAENVLPVATPLYLPQFVSEETQRELALEMCCELLADCDEVQVYGGTITEGMQREIEHAIQRGIRVRFINGVEM